MGNCCGNCLKELQHDKKKRCAVIAGVGFGLFTIILLVGLALSQTDAGRALWEKSGTDEAGRTVLTPVVANATGTPEIIPDPVIADAGTETPAPLVEQVVNFLLKVDGDYNALDAAAIVALKGVAKTVITNILAPYGVVESDVVIGEPYAGSIMIPATIENFESVKAAMDAQAALEQQSTLNTFTTELEDDDNVLINDLVPEAITADASAPQTDPPAASTAPAGCTVDSTAADGVTGVIAASQNAVNGVFLAANSKLKWQCREGYSRDGQPATSANNFVETTCDGTNFNAVPACAPVSCPATNTNALYSDGSVGSTALNLVFPELAEVTCSNGYSLDGTYDANAGAQTFEVICRGDGTYGPANSLCQPVRCPITAPEHTSLMAAHTVIGSNDTFAKFGVAPPTHVHCDTGYTTDGFPDNHTGLNDNHGYDVTCLANGTIDWNGEACEPVKCTSFDETVNGGTTTANTVISYPNTIRYECDEGYTLDSLPRAADGSNSGWDVQCLPTGNFQSRAGLAICTRVTCGSIVVPVNGSWDFQSNASGAVGFYGDRRNITCNPGYESSIKGVGSGVWFKECTADGTWSDVDVAAGEEACLDIDECALETDQCKLSTKCVNAVPQAKGTDGYLCECRSTDTMYPDANDPYGCTLKSWTYGAMGIAGVIFVGGVIGIVCCIQKRKNSGKQSFENDAEMTRK